MGSLTALYDRLPIAGQHAAISAYGYYWHWVRFGPGYQRRVQEYQEREFFTGPQWQRWQQRRLEQFLPQALEVPYYAQNWTRDERRAAEAGRLGDLPLLEKNPVRNDARQFLNPSCRPALPLVLHTSGSTGTPVANYWTWPEQRDSRAVRETRSAAWAGVSYREPRATFTGRFIVPRSCSSGPFHRYNRAERQICFSAFHIRPENATQYVQALHDHHITWITGYSVAAFLLGQLMLEQRLTPPRSLQAIITTSEPLTEEMRDVMQRAYRCRVYEEYSTGENCVFATECEEGRLHVSPDVSVVEILRPDGTPCEPGEPGEVVTTCLMRQFQPLIRYRVGDVASWSDERCPCGREMPVLKEVVGRMEDVIVGPDGRRMVRFHGVFADQPHVREGQVIQEAVDRIRVKVVPTDGFGASDVLDIQQRVRDRLGPVQVDVEPVAEIPRTKAGKFKAVVSLIGSPKPTQATEVSC